MPIFNSVGSNYNLNFSLKVLSTGLPILSAKQNQKIKAKLVNQLEQRFEGSAVLLAKGRDALEYILLSYGIGKDDAVLTQAFTCYALEEAIKRVGAKAIYFDLEKNSLHPNLDQLKKLKQKHANIKALVLQYSLGSSLETKLFKKFCVDNNLILIEDLAQGFGGQDFQQLKLGTQANAILLSFGRDKILDAVSGGAVIFNTPPKVKLELPKQSLALKEKLRLKTYPILNYLIRKTHHFVIGKLLHFCLKKTGCFTNAIYSPNQNFWPMPDFLMTLVSYRLQTVHAQLKHRQKIAEIYWQSLNNISEVTLITSKEDLAYGSNLRFVIAVDDPKALLKYLAQHKIYLADRWYRASVDCGSNVCHSVYQQGSCHNAENLAKRVINLPTHQEITPASAKKIISLIKAFYR